MFKNSQKNNAHNEILGYDFPEYPAWDSKTTGKADLHHSQFLGTYWIKAYLQNSEFPFQALQS